MGYAEGEGAINNYNTFWSQKILTENLNSFDEWNIKFDHVFKQFIDFKYLSAEGA